VKGVLALIFNTGIFLFHPTIPNYPKAKFPGVVVFSEIYQGQNIPLHIAMYLQQLPTRGRKVNIFKDQNAQRKDITLPIPDRFLSEVLSDCSKNKLLTYTK
jgi:hypothetical protein